MGQDDEKKARAAKEAVGFVRSGQILGLGTGSTSRFAVIEIGERFRSGALRDIIGVPTSEATRVLAEEYGIPLAPIDRHRQIDLALDGADEVDPNLDLIKGLGGALLREKAVEVKAKTFVVMVDDTKLVKKLGTKAPVPVEVGQNAWTSAKDELRNLGCTPELRRDASGKPKTTDQNNYVLDCRFENGIDDPKALADALDRMPDVKAHGLFLKMASLVVVGTASGVYQIPPRTR